MSYADFLARDRRLHILRILAQAPGYEANEVLLRDALDTLGHNVARDVVAGELAWLAEQGLVTIEHLQAITVATITDRGLDVANGRSTVPGVRRPRPGE